MNKESILVSALNAYCANKGTSALAEIKICTGMSGGALGGFADSQSGLKFANQVKDYMDGGAIFSIAVLRAIKLFKEGNRFELTSV